MKPILVLLILCSFGRADYISSLTPTEEAVYRHQMALYDIELRRMEAQERAAESAAERHRKFERDFTLRQIAESLRELEYRSRR